MKLKFLKSNWNQNTRKKKPSTKQKIETKSDLQRTWQTSIKQAVKLYIISSLSFSNISSNILLHNSPTNLGAQCWGYLEKCIDRMCTINGVGGPIALATLFI